LPIIEKLNAHNRQKKKIGAKISSKESSSTIGEESFMLNNIYK